MTQERWAHLAPLVDAVLDRPPGQRQAYIAEISGADSALAAELTRFADAPDDSFLEAAGKERAALMSPRSFASAIDLFAELQTSLGATHTIERELVGGMSRLFVAEERQLERRVVIKVLPPEVSRRVSAERFTREIKLAASLQQANIVPLLSAGTVAGFPYYIMPFVEGPSLRDRLRREGIPPIGEAIGILRDVARALAFAHGRGVVHRDIKPGNILLSDRTAVVVDFGIAKAVALDHSADEETLIGTPAYMSPEQATLGASVDHRADIYAFGCVAFELLTGKRAFAGASLDDVLAAQLRDTPPLIAAMRPEVPVAVAQLVASCLEKDASRRPQDAEQLLTSLDGAASHSRGPSTSRVFWLSIAAVSVLALAAAGRTFFTSKSTDASPLTLAVVPFRNITGDTSLDYRSDGVAQEILNGMSKVEGVQVVARTDAFRYKARNGDNPPDPQAIERGLRAQLLITGALRQRDDRITISAQLNDSASTGAVWAESFSGGVGDVGRLTDSIVRRVADTLRARFGSRIAPPRRPASAIGTTNAAALDLYWTGVAQLRRRDIPRSISSFQRAIERDDGFARAHAELALALELEPFFDGTPPAELIGLTLTEANRALALDSTLADAWVALGNARGLSAQWSASDTAMRRAIALDGENVTARQTFARQLIVRGKVDEAIEQLERTHSIDPASPLVSAWLSYALYLAGMPDSALAQTMRTIELDSTLLATTNLGSLVSLSLGRNDIARKLVKAPVTRGMTNAPYVFAKLGDTASANRLIRAMERGNPRPWFTDVARASVSLATGDSANALAALERSAHDSGALWVFFIPLGDPAYDVIRHSERFAALVRQANIESNVITAPRRAR